MKLSIRNHDKQMKTVNKRRRCCLEVGEPPHGSGRPVLRIHGLCGGPTSRFFIVFGSVNPAWAYHQWIPHPTHPVPEQTISCFMKIRNKNMQNRSRTVDVCFLNVSCSNLSNPYPDAPRVGPRAWGDLLEWIGQHGSRPLFQQGYFYRGPAPPAPQFHRIFMFFYSFDSISPGGDYHQSINQRLPRDILDGFDQQGRDFH